LRLIRSRRRGMRSPVPDPQPSRRPGPPCKGCGTYGRLGQSCVAGAVSPGPHRRRTPLGRGILQGPGAPRRLLSLFTM